MFQTGYNKLKEKCYLKKVTNIPRPLQGRSAIGTILQFMFKTIGNYLKCKKIGGLTVIYDNFILWEVT